MKAKKVNMGRIVKGVKCAYHVGNQEARVIALSIVYNTKSKAA